MSAISLDHVTKRYRSGGGITDLDLDVEVGEVVGFLGPNGAGKSTTIRLLLGLIRPDSGTITVLGCELARRTVDVRRRIGYLPGELNLWERLSGCDLLGHLACLRHRDLTVEIEALARRLDLDLDRTIRELSRGNKQKIGIVAAFMGAPELIILDEPTSGLDPLVQREVRHLVDEARDRRATVLLSSHVLSEVSQVADRIAFLRDGALVATEAISAIESRSTRDIRVRTATPAAQILGALPGAHVLEADGQLTHLTLAGPVDPVVKVLAALEVLDLSIGEPDLEDLFLSLYEEPTRVAPEEVDRVPA
ncbi:ABC transporter ATP-binding protein [soil metagenome]